MTATGTAVVLRHDLELRITDARSRTDELFRILRPDALYERPIPERHRIIFYLGHLEAFAGALIGRRARGVEAFQEDLDRLFAFGIDPVDGGLPTDQPSDWPELPEVQQYCARLRSEIDTILRGDWGDSPILADGLGFHVAIEHRLMHAETLAYLLHQVPLARKHPAPAMPQPASAPVTRHGVRIPAGRATLGMPRGSGVFGWDNEFGERVADVPAFRIDSHPVTNGEFLAFVTAGGYGEPRLWSEEDWAWRTAHSIEHPGFWARRGDAWMLKCMFQEIALPASWPA